MFVESTKSNAMGFVDIGLTLASKIQPTNTNYKEYLCGDYPDSFALF